MPGPEGDAGQSSRPAVSSAPERDSTGVDQAAADEIVERLTPLVPAESLPQVSMIVGEGVGQVTTHHSGPLPRASELAAYRDIDPTFAERIVRMAEKEQEHRHTLPDKMLKRDYQLKSRGQHYALTLAIIILLFGAFLAFLGDTRTAGAVAVATLVGIVTVFVGGRAVDALADRRGNGAEIADEDD